MVKLFINRHPFRLLNLELILTTIKANQPEYEV